MRTVIYRHPQTLKLLKVELGPGGAIMDGDVLYDSSVDGPTVPPAVQSELDTHETERANDAAQAAVDKAARKTTIQNNAATTTLPELKDVVQAIIDELGLGN